MGRVLYGAVFCVGLPLLLWAWTVGLDRVVALPVVQSAWIGSAIALCGLVLMLAGMWMLWRDGGGLPMNAFPPQRFVRRGVYGLVAHPIYFGFVLSCGGVSVASGSAAGLWIMTPIAALGCWALVAGYERDAITARFRGQSLMEGARPWLSLPIATEDRPNVLEAIGATILVFVPWLVMYEGVGHLPVPGAIDSYIAAERHWPVWTWTEAAYILAYPWAVLMLSASRTRRELRERCVDGLVATALGALCYVCLPFIAWPREMSGEGLCATLLRWERSGGFEGRGSMPSFHVFWALTAARVYARRWPGLAWVVWTIGVAIAASCVTTGMHSMADVLGGVVFAVVVWRWRDAWRLALRASEVIANSWREWRSGPLRVIVHGAYAGLAACVGTILLGMMMGPEALPWIGLVALAGLVGAALWGQALEGAAVSLRPFGYYGYVLGAVAAWGILLALGVVDARWAAALAVAAPWVQAIGRLRCLVQGCCHGRATVEWGMVYRHPMSRACRAGLAGTSVHATPTYSIIGNLIIGAILIRLWCVGATSGLVVGAYLILSGLARFVEEHYRGEPQTRIVWGLRVYQWIAIACVLVGMCVSVVPGWQVGRVHLNWESLVWGVGMAVVYWLAMGVDMPDSSKRFSRLA